MICPKCQKGRHKKCEAPQSCSCQHKKQPKPEPATGPAGE